MTTLDAGTLRSTGTADQRLTLLQTVHGVVQGYATVDGRRIALAQQRSTRSRDVLSARALYELDTGRVTSAKSFVKTVSTIEAMFNFFYVDDRDIAHVTAGRLPVRAPDTDPSLPTVGTGEYDWRGFLGAGAHPQTINPGSGAIVDWNSKPARGWGASDDNWSYGSVQRKQLLTGALGAGKRDVSQIVAAANKAATQDLRVMEVWPIIADVLRTAPTPNVRVGTAADLLVAWRAFGGSRLDTRRGRKDRSRRGRDHGCRLAAVRQGGDAPRARRSRGAARTAAPGVRRSQHTGIGVLDGWYGYVDKDLRRLLGHTVRGPYETQFCGGGNLDSCRESLWSALEQACDLLQAKQGVEPTAWRADARPERIGFTTGLIRDTMAWTNRPTFQQVMSFSRPPRDAVAGSHQSPLGRLARVPAKRYLFTPGPTPVPPQVLAALAEPVVHHRGSDFRPVYQACLERLKELCRTSSDVLLFTSSGTGAMESAVANLCGPGSRVLVVSAGAFGERWIEIAERYGCEVVPLRYEWGEIPQAGDIAAQLEELSEVRAVFLTHSETSTGVVSDLQAHAEAIRPSGAHVVVDAVSSLGAVPLEMDAWGVDVVCSGSQKALMTPPGLAVAAVSDAVWKPEGRLSSPRYYFDWERTRKAQDVLDAPFTPAVSLVAGLNVALGLMFEEGLEAVFDRHVRLGRACRAGAKALGLELFSPDDDTSAVVTAIKTPQGVDAAELVSLLRERYGVQLAKGHGQLGSTVFRIGHIGYYDVFDVATALAAVELGLAELGAEVELGRRCRARPGCIPGRQNRHSSASAGLPGNAATSCDEGTRQGADRGGGRRAPALPLRGGRRSRLGARGHHRGLRGDRHPLGDEARRVRCWSGPSASG